MFIRPETDRDFAAIREIHLAAFAHHPYSHQTEHLIVDALRAAHALRVSLIAEIEGKVIGHIAFSPALIDDRDCGWYVLGPIGVLPEFQRRGIGRELVQSGLEALRELGAQGCALVGEPAYYCRFGFRRVPELVLDGVPAEYFLCLPMTETIPHGQITHHAAFSVHA